MRGTQSPSARTRSSTGPSARWRRTPSTASASIWHGHSHVAVDFLAYVRGQAKFESLEALLEQMAADVKRCREIVAAEQ
ncbi:hypothetical protein LT493_18325 [Streptomyces tricolor]|nr:hypothetical protein [Streptomyces tricolor]